MPGTAREATQPLRIDVDQLTLARSLVLMSRRGLAATVHCPDQAVPTKAAIGDQVGAHQEGSEQHTGDVRGCASLVRIASEPVRIKPAVASRGRPGRPERGAADRSRDHRVCPRRTRSPSTSLANGISRDSV